MRSLIGSRCLLLTGALAALAAGWIAPSAAHAGCGDNVGHLLPQNARAASPDPLMDRENSIPNPTEHNRNRIPCNGPSCSRSHDPGVPATPPTPPSFQDWSFLPVSGRFLQPGQNEMVEVPNPFTPVPFAADIYHPPRLSLNS